MKIDEIQVLKYVQKELDAQEMSAFEIEMAENPLLAESVDKMKASMLPYETALSADRFAPVPESIQALIDSEGEQQTSAQQQYGTRKHSGISVVRYAALALFSFAVGYGFHAAQIVQVSPEHLVLADESAPKIQDLSVQADLNPSEDAVTYMAIYQALYARETVEGIQQSQAEAELLMSNQTAEYGQALSIADLKRFGYTFKRAQVLRFGSSPIVQMVYLGSEGKPIAICAFQKSALPSSVDLNQIFETAGMDLLAREQEEVIYVLMTPQDRPIRVDLFDWFKNLS